MSRRVIAGAGPHARDGLLLPHPRSVYTVGNFSPTVELPMARDLNDWFALYGESHQNPTNKLIHFICVPAIYFSIMGLLWWLPTPDFFPAVINWATLSLLITLPFYARLSPLMLAGMATFSACCFILLAAMDATGISVIWTSALLFVAAWILQFVGHSIEGKKPSFFEDLQFLLVGPAWILGFIYRKTGIALQP
jgi:uncharacterized membrane protein YGL010W